MEIKIVWNPSPHPGIVPVFLPFLGCKNRCVFCAQDYQTGKKPPQDMHEIQKILEESKLSLIKYRNKWNRCAELAFYGGTFTLLPDDIWEVCINFVRTCRKEGIISQFRCSTRPDSLDERRLLSLKYNGCYLIELGVQSFKDQALTKAKRGYDERVIEIACKRVKEFGFKLGVQLLPGMPDLSPAEFLQDVRRVISIKPYLLRFYPCLVIAQTGLENMWRNGEYQPWTLDETIETLAKAYALCQINKLTVSRIGLAPDENLHSNIIAGPVHPCLGSRISALALYKIIFDYCTNILQFSRIEKICLPPYIQGFFWGWRGELKKKWAEIGVEGKNIEWWKKKYIYLKIK